MSLANKWIRKKIPSLSNSALMGDDIETGKITGSDYGAALSWLSENQN